METGTGILHTKVRAWGQHEHLHVESLADRPQQQRALLGLTHILAKLHTTADVPQDTVSSSASRPADQRNEGSGPRQQSWHSRNQSEERKELFPSVAAHLVTLQDCSPYIFLSSPQAMSIRYPQSNLTLFCPGWRSALAYVHPSLISQDVLGHLDSRQYPSADTPLRVHFLSSQSATRKVSSWPFKSMTNQISLLRETST